MNVGHIHLMLDGTEPVRAEVREALDAFEVGPVSLTLGHWNTTPTVRAAFLRKLAEAASDLADEIVLRDLEAAS